jgi:hypothetical protein
MHYVDPNTLVPRRKTASLLEPKASHVSPTGHEPQLPPQPSSPHNLPVQSGRHTQAPPSPQTLPDWQLPHEPPQPSGPQAR